MAMERVELCGALALAGRAEGLGVSLRQGSGGGFDEVLRDVASQEEDAARGTKGALAREQDKIAAELEREQLANAERLQLIRDYIETCGAPEEKDQDRVEETFWERLQKEDDPRRRGIPALANQTWGITVQDPQDEGKMHVYAVKTDATGKAKITRHVEFDSGDGEGRSKLTRARAKAAEDAEHAGAGESVAGQGKQRAEREKDRKA